MWGFAKKMRQSAVSRNFFYICKSLVGIKMHFSSHIRLFLARFFLILLSAIIVSGLLFIHKHTTRDGQIVIHIHPYDFTSSSSDNDHHRSDDEIYHLNIVFQGNYLITGAMEVELPGVLELRGEDLIYTEFYGAPVCTSLPYLRGPPPADTFRV